MLLLGLFTWSFCGMEVEHLACVFPYPFRQRIHIRGATAACKWPVAGQIGGGAGKDAHRHAVTIIMFLVTYANQLVPYEATDTSPYLSAGCLSRGCMKCEQFWHSRVHAECMLPVVNQEKLFTCSPAPVCNPSYPAKQAKAQCRDAWSPSLLLCHKVQAGG